jgi:hypothetical protein
VVRAGDELAPQTGFALIAHRTLAPQRKEVGRAALATEASRKLACLFWALLTREEDYAYAQPSLTKKKLRQPEITAGQPRYTPKAAGIYAANTAVREAERELARQAEVAYARTVRDWHAAQVKKVGASATPGRASNKPSKGKAARQTQRATYKRASSRLVLGDKRSLPPRGPFFMAVRSASLVPGHRDARKPGRATGLGSADGE